jgi:pimeloyl-ACP methyl ester carboxylesterase
LIGHSEGGIVAPMVAARRAETAFVVLLAGTGVTGEQVMLSQAEAMAKAAGAPPQAIEQNAAMQKRIFALMKEESDPQKLAEKLAGVLPAGPQGDAQIRQLTSPWFRFFLTYDPALALEKTKCPVLALNGELDLQVAPALNLPPIEAALRKGGNKDVRIERLPGLNHLFQPAKTGLVNEYAQIEETMSPKVLDLIASWIRERAAR